MVSSFSEQKDLALSFVQDYMTQQATQLAMFEAGGRAPAHVAAFEEVSTRRRRRRVRRSGGPPGSRCRSTRRSPPCSRRSAWPRPTCSKAPTRRRSSPTPPTPSASRSAGSHGHTRGQGGGRPSGALRPAGLPGRGVAPSTPPGTTTGWIIKIVLLGLADAIRRLLGLVDRVQRGVLGLLRGALWSPSSCSKCRVPARGLRADEVPAAGCLLPVWRFGVYPVLYTAYLLMMNYGTGFVLFEGPGDRADPEPVDHSGRGSHRSTTSRRWRPPTGRSLAMGFSTRRPAKPSSAPTDGLEGARRRHRDPGPDHDRAHVHRQRW